MKLKTTLFCLGILFTISSHSEGKAKCEACEKMVSIGVRLPDEGALEEGVKLLQMHEFAKKSSERAQEITAFVNLAVKLLVLDTTGDSDSFFYEAYKEFPKEFDAVIARLPGKDRDVVKKSLSEMDSISKHGNG